MSPSRLLAVSFPDQAAAQAAAGIIDARFSPNGGIHVAALGFATYPTPSGGVLTGWFRDDVITAVRSAVEELGGTVEIDLDEKHGRRR
jgi:hypothetical protein